MRKDVCIQAGPGGSPFEDRLRACKATQRSAHLEILSIDTRSGSRSEASGNQTAISRYKKTFKGGRATFRARHLAEYQKRALIAVPKREMPKVSEYMTPPISWLLAGAQLTWQEARAMLDSGELRINHTTWSLRYHPDKVEVNDRTILGAT